MSDPVTQVGRRPWSGLWPGPSGGAVAGVFVRAYGLILVVAWLSLALQIRLLIGRDGLLPLDTLLATGPGGGLPLLAYPSVLRWPTLAGDGWLLAGAWLGVGLGACALLGLVPRLCFSLSTVLYLSYATACRGFLSFQWDNLLLECGLLAAFLPRHRPAPAVHLLFRVLLFKLYFESGLAKGQSASGDWIDGSAMTFYYETAPLPTWLAFYAHNLPAAWHHLESRATLFLELGLPPFIFGPRRARLVAAGAFSFFQVINAATANYGFFCFLALGLHLFLLDDQDIERVRTKLLGILPARLRRRFEPAQPGAILRGWPLWPAGLRRTLVACGLGTYLAISLIEGLERFGPRAATITRVLLPLERLYAPFRLVNTYQLFASVTRERVEPQIEIRSAGIWQEHDLRYKPGAPERAPPFVAPHQPRIDFLLWFHGLDWQRLPVYLFNLLERACQRPETIRTLFAAPLPTRPESVRVVYYRYHFATVSDRRTARSYWRRTREGQTGEMDCPK